MRPEGNCFEETDSSKGTGRSAAGRDELNIPQWEIVEAGKSTLLHEEFLAPALRSLEALVRNQIKDLRTILKKGVKNGR